MRKAKAGTDRRAGAERRERLGGIQRGFVVLHLQALQALHSHAQPHPIQRQTAKQGVWGDIIAALVIVIVWPHRLQQQPQHRPGAGQACQCRHRGIGH